MKKYLIINLLMLALVCSATIAVAATTDFVANDNITVSSVAGDGVTADLIIFNGSNAESWTADGSSLSVTNPDATNPFRVGSSNSSVASIRTKNASGSEIDCANNTTPGSSYENIPANNSGTFTVYPSNSLCSTGSSHSFGGGGGGGGAPAPNATTTPVMTPPASAVTIPANFSSLTPAQKQAVIVQVKTLLRSLIAQLIQLLRDRLQTLKAAH